MAYHDAVMERKGGLTKAEKEMVIVATSNQNGCQYCVIAHGAILRVRTKDPLIADQVAINYTKADIEEGAVPYTAEKSIYQSDLLKLMLGNH